MTDPIVEEVRAVRARIAEECEYDLGRILDHARVAAEKIPGLTYVTSEALQARRGNAASTATTPSVDRRVG